MHKVYIILVNYRNYPDTIECLQSILHSNCADYQIVLIDNSLDDISSEKIIDWCNNGIDHIETLFPELVYPLIDKPISYKFYRQEEFSALAAESDQKLLLIRAENRGFAAANNIALNYILKFADDSSFAWVLNNDTIIEKDTIKNLVAFYDNNDLNYIIGCKLMFYNNWNTLQAIAGSYNKWLGAHKHIGEGEIDNGQYDDFKFNGDNYIVGASMFLPKLFLNSAGLMCEDYFLYYEELDWIIRARRAGFKCAVQPLAIVYHKEGASITNNRQNKDTSLAEYYSMTNRVRFIKKFYKWCLPTVLLGVIFGLTKRLFKGKFTLVKKTSKTVLQILIGA
jgi:hypothetical protein